MNFFINNISFPLLDTRCDAGITIEVAVNDAIKKFPEFEKSIKIYLFEKSERLIKIQKNFIKDKNVTWVKSLAQIKDGPILFFGNEFFDSVPIKQFAVEQSFIYEKFIHLKNNKFKKFIFKKVSKKTIKKLKELGIDAEIIDLRTIRPIDFDTIVDSVKKTNRCVTVEESFPVCSIGSYIGSQIMIRAFDYLDAPVLNCTGKDVPMPYAENLEKAALITPEEIVFSVKQVLYKD